MEERNDLNAVERDALREVANIGAGHAATAVFSAKLYSASARKLTTLQGFLDMLKQPGKP